jgi:serine O-acetyltransferase
MRGMEIGDEVIPFRGSKVLGGPGVTRVGSGTILAAIAVLATSTDEWETRGGVAPRKLADRVRRIGDVES